MRELASSYLNDCIHCDVDLIAVSKRGGALAEHGWFIVKERTALKEMVPSTFREMGETLALGEGEHGFGLGGVERGFVGLVDGLLEQLGFLHSSKRIIIKKF